MTPARVVKSLRGGDIIIGELGRTAKAMDTTARNEERTVELRVAKRIRSQELETKR